MNMYWLCKAIRNIFNIYLSTASILYLIVDCRKFRKEKKVTSCQNSEVGAKIIKVRIRK